jgi:hypothetical protein
MTMTHGGKRANQTGRPRKYQPKPGERRRAIWIIATPEEVALIAHNLSISSRKDVLLQAAREKSPSLP